MSRAPTADELLVAIRAHCLECSGGVRKMVERCEVRQCKLYPYRSVAALGVVKVKVKAEGAQISMFDEPGGKSCGED